jgi:uncharacterized protein
VRAVIDNNLLVSGLLWEGKPSCLLAAVADGRVHLLLSDQLLAELVDVLRREKFAARLALKGLTAETAVSTLQTVARVVLAANIPVPASLRDPDDVHVLACAVSAGADAVVTGDRDLLALGTYARIPIIDVREALRELGLDE